MTSGWWGKYQAYLRSPEWQIRRGKVLARSRGMCESCGDRPAREVHHLTYKHLGREPLWDLRAVCEPCHAYLTEVQQQKKAHA